MGTDSECAGFVFGCDNHTEQECLRLRLFGHLARYRTQVLSISTGLPLFLYNYSTKELICGFEADGCGRWSILPTAFKGRFMAQVRIKVTNPRLPRLPEQVWGKVLYGSSGCRKLTSFRLNSAQVAELTSLANLNPKRPLDVGTGLERGKRAKVNGIWNDQEGVNYGGGSFENGSGEINQGTTVVLHPLPRKDACPLVALICLLDITHKERYRFVMVGEVGRKRVLFVDFLSKDDVSTLSAFVSGKSWAEWSEGEIQDTSKISWNFWSECQGIDALRDRFGQSGHWHPGEAILCDPLKDHQPYFFSALVSELSRKEKQTCAVVETNGGLEVQKEQGSKENGEVNEQGGGIAESDRGGRVDGSKEMDLMEGCAESDGKLGNECMGKGSDCGEGGKDDVTEMGGSSREAESAEETLRISHGTEEGKLHDQSECNSHRNRDEVKDDAHQNGVNCKEHENSAVCKTEGSQHSETKVVNQDTGQENEAIDTETLSKGIGSDKGGPKWISFESCEILKGTVQTFDYVKCMETVRGGSGSSDMTDVLLKETLGSVRDDLRVLRRKMLEVLELRYDVQHLADNKDHAIFKAVFERIKKDLKEEEEDLSFDI